MFRLSKRRRFILSSLVLTAGFSYIQFGDVADRYRPIFFLSLSAIILTFWCLRESLKGLLFFVCWILPLFFTAGVGFFYFLLPSSLFIALPVIILYFLGMYTLFLSENIFSVAAIRTIQLFRSAWAVSFLLTLLSSFLLFDTVYSFRLSFYQNFLLIFLTSFFLFFHGVWSIELSEKINFRLILYSLLLSLGVGEISLILSFWPSSIILNSLFLTSLIYVSLGLTQAKLNGRLFGRTLREYLLVGLAVFSLLLFHTSWG